MPWFTLHRNFSMATTAGHVIGFKKGEATWVPPACVPNAVAIGAQPVESLEAGVDVIPPEAQAPPAPTPEEKQAKYFDAFEKLIVRARRDDFLASGLPHLRKLEELTGFSTTSAERDAMWTKYNEAKAEEAAQQ